jgi:hypothetical protein
MVYPGSGIPLSTGSAWGTSITNNSTNWNTAYGWGNHASAGYLTAETDPYAVLLAGRSGGQTIKGGTGEGENLSFWTNATGVVGHYYFTDLTDNGFVKTSGGTGLLSIDTTTYLDTTTAGTTYLKLDQTTPQSVINGTPSFYDIKIPSMSLGTPTYSTVNDYMDSFGSTGRKTGGVITDATGGYIAVTAGTGFIKATDDDNAPLLFFDFPAPANIQIPASSTRYIGVEYNSGTPQVVARTTFNWNFDTEFPLGVVINENINGTDELNVYNAPWWITDSLTNLSEVVRS